jgi:hypothetical protein
LRPVGVLGPFRFSVNGGNRRLHRVRAGWRASQS